MGYKNSVLVAASYVRDPIPDCSGAVFRSVLLPV